MPLNFSVVMTGVRCGDDLEQAVLARVEHRLDVTLENPFERLRLLPLRVLGCQGGNAVEGKRELEIDGCSAQSVPSLSNTAMRFSGTT